MFSEVPSKRQILICTASYYTRAIGQGVPAGASRRQLPTRPRYRTCWKSLRRCKRYLYTPQPIPQESSHRSGEEGFVLICSQVYFSACAKYPCLHGALKHSSPGLIFHSPPSPTCQPIAPHSSSTKTVKYLRNAGQLKMQSLDILQISMVLLIQGKAAYANTPDNFGCAGVPDHGAAGCAAYQPEVSGVKMMIAPWNGKVGAYDCTHMDPAFKRASCCADGDGNRWIRDPEVLELVRLSHRGLVFPTRTIIFLGENSVQYKLDRCYILLLRCK
ncbi:hypothetical protein PSTG_11167 [Puccinia striiformis f. sp. tritici PST-78]|uniref:Uncharacterized protein n=1 Tax=Puccinia striiformis f. sp. tritici PST-78 TaxID=1165861 RepID=A0A0L0V8F1_9BASI|nr:hypothetical protein PSTG_11167 [Puccinia striiformis f. sp. tritici PST-78]